MDKNLNRGFSAVGVIIILVVIGIIAGGVYFYLNLQMPKTENQTTTSENETVQNTTTNPQVNQEDLTKLSPKEMWIKMKTEADEAKTIDELFTISRKYTTKEKVAFWDSQIAQYNAMSQSVKDGLFSMMKTSIPTLDKINIEGIQTQIVDDKATLQMTTKDFKHSAKVTLLKEDGAWKIEEESWK